MRASRILGALLAIGMQAGLAALLLNTKTARPRTPAQPETILIFPVPRPATAPLAKTTAQRDNRAAVPSSSTEPPAPPSSVTAPQPDISSLGEMLFGCAPESYANLSSERRARCPRPGEGLAIGQPPDLMGTRSHVKNEAHWRQEWARVHSPALLPCGGFTNLLCLLGKITDGSLDDYGDPGKWPIYVVKQLPEAGLRQVQERYDARHHDEPALP